MPKPEQLKRLTGAEAVSERTVRAVGDRPAVTEPITTENTTLRQRVRQLTRENRVLEERLQAARSNNKFADRRIAQLEAQLTECLADVTPPGQV